MVSGSIPDGYNWKLKRSRDPSTLGLTRILCDNWSATCYYHQSTSAVYGELVNGTWMGMLDDINKDVYDTSLPDFTPLPRRAKDFLFADTWLRYPLFVATRNLDGPEDYEVFGVLKSFAPKIWMVLLAYCVIISSSLVLMRTVSNEKFSVAVLRTFIGTFVFLLRKQMNLQVSRISAKLLLLAWGLACVIITSMYSSMLLASMFRRQSKIPFNDLGSLADCIWHMNCKMVAIPEGDWFFSLLDDATDLDSLRLKEALLKNPPEMMKSESAAFRYIHGREDIFLVSWPTTKSYLIYLENLTLRECTTTFVELSGYQVVNTFPFAKNQTILKEALNERLSRLVESGIAAHIIDFFSHRQQCGNKISKPHLNSLPVKIILGSLAMLAIGLICSSIVCVIERYHYLLRCHDL